MVVFKKLISEFFILLKNFHKLKYYFFNYKKNKSYIFNSMFRFMARSTTPSELYNFLKQFEWLKYLSSTYLVFLTLSAQLNNKDDEVLSYFSFLKKMKMKMKIDFVNLGQFRSLHKNINLFFSKHEFYDMFRVSDDYQTYKAVRLFLEVYPVQTGADLEEFKKIKLPTKSSKYFSIYKLIDIDGTDSEKIINVKKSNYNFLDPLCYSDNEIQEPRTAKIPDQIIWKLFDVKVNGTFQVFKNDGYILYDKSADPRNGFVAGHWQTTDLIQNTDYVLIYENTQNIVEIDAAVLISGRCTQNYFHWVIEYIPKIILYAKSGSKANSLLVGHGMPKQHYDFLKFLCEKYNLSYFEIKPNTHVKVKELFIPSQHTYIPDDSKYEYWQGGAIDTEAINALADHGYEMLDNSITHKASKDYERIYISRKNTRARSITNESAIENLFQQHGFDIIDTSLFSFTEQVKLFKNAKIIASPTGAAMANLAFCQPGTKIICLVSTANKKFCIQANIAISRLCTFTYVVGDIVYPRSNFTTDTEYRFSDFFVPLEKLKKMLNELDDLDQIGRETKNV